MATVIDLVRQTRNDLIKKFLDTEYIRAYFLEKYGVLKLSDVRVEFLKRDLTESLSLPVDLVHYALILKELKTGNDVQLIHRPAFQKLFTDELHNIFKKYSY
jgi:hypothetical protein